MGGVGLPGRVVGEHFGIQPGHQPHHGGQDDSFAAVAALVVIAGVDPGDDRDRRPPFRSAARRHESDLRQLGECDGIVSVDARLNDPGQCVGIGGSSGARMALIVSRWP